ncbi:hypothetical protein IBT49_22960 [Erwinia sp. S63]|uniref:hypothetical protein n=1 Tax=Erwinia sp. S63 TaxID=2769341 RepID=UPI00190D9CF7|nr:hypothetical protein [Erwinia sp. S63]MBK0098861.1 hypothetical protein [Erwinia sp. S63]
MTDPVGKKIFPIVASIPEKATPHVSLIHLWIRRSEKLMVFPYDVDALPIPTGAGSHNLLMPFPRDLVPDPMTFPLQALYGAAQDRTKKLKTPKNCKKALKN